MTRRLAILGATGSIGQSALSLLGESALDLEVVCLSAHRNLEALVNASAPWPEARRVLTGRRPGDPSVPAEAGYGFGPEGLLESLEAADPDLVLNGITGAAGIEASAWTLAHGKTLCLANKESLVLGGPWLLSLAAETGARILPVDSEHAAIHQCLRGERRTDIRCIYLTASGGALRDVPLEDLDAIEPTVALRHPNWSMGARITIGSATMMNKAFEVLEAHHLFDLPGDRIRVLLHRQSIVHGMVSFRDGSIVAQLGKPDMRVPIHYCLAWPDRGEFAFDGFDPEEFASLTFETVDPRRFPALALGYECLERGGDAGSVLNAADEIATEAFLKGRISFRKIAEIVEKVLERHVPRPISSIEEILAADEWAREEARRCLDSV